MSGPLETSEAKALVRRFVEAVNSRDHGLLDEFVHPDFVRMSPSTPDLEIGTLAEFKQFLAVDAATFPDGRMTLETVVAEGDLVAFWGKYTGTQRGAMGPFPPTGKSVSVDCSGFFRLRGDKLAEARIVWDNLALLSQLGHH